MATKIRSVFDKRLHFAFSATGLDDVTYAIPFLICVTGKIFCPDFTLILCFMHLVQGPTAQGSFWHSVVNRIVRQVTIGRSGTFLVCVHHTDSSCQYRS